MRRKIIGVTVGTPTSPQAIIDKTEQAEKIERHEQDIKSIRNDVDELKQSGGVSGENGATFIPSVASDGVLSWTNDKELPNPTPVNIKGKNGKDGSDGFSPVVAVADIEGGHRVTITDKDGTKTFDVMDGKDGQGGSGGTSVQSDWNVNDENDPAYVKNKTHWVERPFEPIVWDGNTEGRDSVDLSLVFGVPTGSALAYKISNKLLTPEEVKVGTVFTTRPNDITVGSDRVDWTEVMPYVYMVEYMSVLYGEDGATEDYAYGTLFVIGIEGDFTESFGVVIPSVGTYCMQGLSHTLDINNDTYHTLDDRYLPDSVASKAYLFRETEKMKSELALKANSHDTTVYGSLSMGRSPDHPIGLYSVAVGSHNVATGIDSFAKGVNTKALADGSHAEGQSTTANGEGSHAEGRGTDARGKYSHAEGQSTTANGEGSHAEGQSTIASGDYSHAEGYNTVARGKYSHAEGQSTIASGDYSHVEGKWNLISEVSGTYAHVVGNGFDALNRSNAHTLNWQGLGWFAGGLKVGGTWQDDPNAEEILTKSQVQSMIDDAIATEEWVFTLEDGTEVKKAVCLK